MIFWTLEAGIPVISDKKDDVKSIKGETEVTAAFSCLRVHVLLLTYTHHTKARAWPRSAGVYR